MSTSTCHFNDWLCDAPDQLGDTVTGQLVSGKPEFSTVALTKREQPTVHWKKTERKIMLFSFFLFLG